MIKEQKLSVISLDISHKAEHAMKLALTWKDGGSLVDVTFNLKNNSEMLIVKCLKDTSVEKEIINGGVLGNVLSVTDGVLVTIEGTDLKGTVVTELYDGVFERAIDEDIPDSDVITVFKG